MNVDSFSIVELLLRVFTGILFLFQGYDKLFRIKIKGVVEAFRSEAAIYQIPTWLLSLLAYYTSSIEFIGGILLVIGLYSKVVLFALGTDLILVTLAFSIVEPMWDTKHVFPRIILICVLLLLQSYSSNFTVEALFLQK